MDKEEIQVNIGKNIAKLRTERGVTVRELSAATGVPSTTISEIENLSGKAIRVSTMCKIAEYFGVSVEYLAGTETPAQNKKQPAISKLSRENAAMINGLDSEQAESLNKFLKKEGQDFVLLLLEMRDARKDLDRYKICPLTDESIKEDLERARGYYRNAQIQKAEFLNFCFEIAEKYIPRADINLIHADIENAEKNALYNGIGNFEEEGSN